MVWDYSHYLATNLGISFGLILVSLVVTGFLFGGRPQVFYALIKNMFDIEYIPLNCEEQPGTETLNLYGEYFVLRKRKDWFWAIPRCCLWVTAGVVIGATLIVFVDGLVLNAIYLTRNQKCPEDGDMDCYSTSGNNTYFHCNSSDILIPYSLGSVTCYRWFKKGISTLDILEQIGLCAGLIQVFNWMVNLYLRLLLYIYAFPSPPTFKKFAHPWLAFIFTLLLVLSPIIALIVLPVRRFAVTGLTMAVAGCALVIVVMMLIFIWTWRRNTRIMIEPVVKLSSNTAARKSSAMTVSAVNTTMIV
jgi:hypothetical protein